MRSVCLIASAVLIATAVAPAQSTLHQQSIVPRVTEVVSPKSQQPSRNGRVSRPGADKNPTSYDRETKLVATEARSLAHRAVSALPASRSQKSSGAIAEASSMKSMPSRESVGAQVRFVERTVAGGGLAKRGVKRGQGHSTGVRQAAHEEEDLSQYILPAAPDPDAPPSPGAENVQKARLGELIGGRDRFLELGPDIGVGERANGKDKSLPAADVSRPSTIATPDRESLTLPLPTELQHGAANEIVGSHGDDLLLQSARNAVRLQRMDLAISRFTEFLRRNPNHTDARLEMVSALVAAGHAEQASQEMDFLVEQFPNDPLLLRRYADLQLQLSRFPRAESALRRLMDHTDQRTDAAVDLARVLAWTSRMPEAIRVYEDLLADIEPKTPKRQQQFAELLIDIERLGKALELLSPLHDADPADISVLRLMIIASARMGLVSSTLDYIGRMENVEPTNVAVRYQLADALFQEGFYREALAVDQQVLASDSTNLDSVVRSALCNLRLYEVNAAKSLLDRISAARRIPKYFRALAEYHSVVGNHADAIAICRQVLTSSPSDLETRMSLGHVHHRASQLTRAISEFGRVILAATQSGVPDGRRLLLAAQLAQARVLAESRRFDEAIGVLEMARGGAANERAILDTQIDVLSRARRYPQAVQLVRSALSTGRLRLRRREARLRATLGLLLARDGQYAAALQEFVAVRPLVEQPTAELVYGSYQAQRMLGNSEEARAVLNTHLSALLSNTYLRVRIAELATEDCDCCLAREMLQHLAQRCFGNPLISNRLGEACLQCASCQQVCHCATYFGNSLAHSPSNVQAMLGLARTHVRRGEYRAADAHYEQACRHMPDDINLIREIARLHSQWKGADGSVPYYEQGLQMMSGEHLVEVAAHNPHQVPELEAEYADLQDVSAVVSTEMQGKLFSGWRPLSAIDAFDTVVLLEPRNEDSPFEMGQAYSQLNRTHCAIDQYERLLCVNPCHREAAIAIERNYLEMQPQIHSFSRYAEQSGRSDLATISHFTTGALLQFPLGEEDEFLQLGYRRAWYEPPGDSQLIGGVATARLQWKPDWALLLFGQADYETYDYGLQPRVNYDVGAQYRYLENAAVRLHLQQQNVIQNRLSIRRDVYRYGGEVGNLWTPCAPLEIDTYYRYWEYSDDNTAHEAGVHTGYKLTYGHDQFRWLTNLDFMTYRDPEVFAGDGSLEMAVHPYFAPRDFFYLSAGLEYRRYLSCDIFKGADRHWFELYGGGGIDSEGNGYGEARGELARDFSNRLSVSGFFTLARSGVYDATHLGSRVTVRF